MTEWKHVVEFLKAVSKSLEVSDRVRPGPSATDDPRVAAFLEALRTEGYTVQKVDG